jgi:3-dehydroquinate dehydratase-2
MSGIHVLVINGPNLNLLGTREPQTYGYDTLSDVEEKCKRAAEAAGGKCSTFQSNYEGAIVERIHQAKADGVDGIVINAGKSVRNLLYRSCAHREVY